MFVEKEEKEEFYSVRRFCRSGTERKHHWTYPAPLACLWEFKKVVRLRTVMGTQKEDPGGPLWNHREKRRGLGFSDVQPLSVSEEMSVVEQA